MWSDMKDYIRGDVFLINIDPFFRDLYKKYKFLNPSKREPLIPIFRTKYQNRVLDEADCYYIDWCIRQHFSDAPFMKSVDSSGDFVDLIFHRFELITKYHANNRISTTKCDQYLCSFFLIIANFFDFKDLMKLHDPASSSVLYRVEKDQFIELPYKSSFELIASEALERAVYYYLDIADDIDVRDLMQDLKLVLPEQLLFQLLPSYRDQYSTLSSSL